MSLCLVLKGEDLQQQEGRFLLGVESLWFEGQHQTPGGGWRQEGEGDRTHL